jgi:AraC family transcriptional regulator of adaptative response/methylated-DNA-[protein]-cysteine methyltransferase
MNNTTLAPFSTDELRWAAVVRRDAAADGAFFCAVKTTGIYCRPICPARRPNRVNVVFYATRRDAERAGFRACKRCRPDAIAAQDPAREAVLQACKLIDEAPEPPALGDLAEAVGLSSSHFHRLFKEVVGITPKAYAATRRLRRLQDGLERGGSVTRAIYDAGFGSSSRCYEAAGAILGMTPTEYRDGAAGVAIRYAVAESYLGHVLIAATERGICRIEFGDSADILRERLVARFPRATLRDADADFEDWVAQVLAYIEAPAGGLSLPLDIQGTAFQRRVWEALREIPAGTTTTYADIAQKIGRPRAARAVGQACAANPVVVVVPCHRVVRGDGDLGGYAGGLPRKRALLEREAGAQAEQDGEATGEAGIGDR